MTNQAATKNSKPCLNLTQHVCSPEQAEGGVFEPQNKAEVQGLLTFNELPTAAQISARAEALAMIARSECAGRAMIGGAPFLMSALENALIAEGIKPLYAFSRRESVDQTQPDGSVRKVATFRHLGFVEVV